MSAPSGTWALVPVKPFERAKTRLAGALEPAARATLAEAMLEDVLAALAGSGALSGVLVVTSDPRAAETATRFGAEAIHDALDSGVDDALSQGLQCLARRIAGRVMVAPSDIPFLTGAEARSVLDALETSPVVMTPAERDGGTNLLALSPIDAIAPAFGPGSLARHAALARAAGIEPRIVRLAGAGLDIDLPADLDLARATGAGTRTRALLAGLKRRDEPRPMRLEERTTQP